MNENNDFSSPSRLIFEIKHLFAARMRATETEDDGVLTQHTARLILGCLSHHERVKIGDPSLPDLTQQRLAELTHMKPPTVSVTLAGMEAEALICRTPDPSDRRVIRVSLTDRGRVANERILERLRASDRVLMDGVSEENRAALIDLLTRLRDNMLRDDTTRSALDDAGFPSGQPTPAVPAKTERDSTKGHVSR